jgi:superoxide dismutase, Cu-Zn family
MNGRRFSRAALIVFGASLASSGIAAAAGPPIVFVAYVMDAKNATIGTARFIPIAKGGTQIIVSIDGLPPGMHGMHIHEFGSCNPLRDTQGNVTVFGAAGGHFDPMNTMHHLGPMGGGHAGDLPMLKIDDGGHGALAYYAPNIATSGANSIVGRSIVIHANADNYTDTPPAGGSDGRIACGEIGAEHAPT